VLTQGGEMEEGRIRMYNYKFHNLYFSGDIIRMMKPIRMIWTGM